MGNRPELPGNASIFGKVKSGNLLVSLTFISGALDRRDAVAEML
jgi:hypothetical protein